MDTPETEKPEVGIEKPEPTWFFRRGDGTVFACGELEAHGILRNRGEWMRKDFALLGHSDGTTYFRILRESAAEAEELRRERQALATDAARYRKTEDRLKFEELRGDDDEHVAKVRGILADLDGRVAALDARLAAWAKDVAKRAFDAELAVATGNMVMPRNMDVHTPVERDRERIIQNLGGRR